MNVLYEERRKSTAISVILAAVTLLFAGVLLIAFRYGAVGEDAAPIWMLVVFIILFALLTFWFRRIDIKLTDEGVRVSYGPFSRSLNWQDIVSCETGPLPWYWGYGIRFAPYKGRWIFVFNVIGGPGVFFLTKNNKPRGLYVSTLHPEQILALARTKIVAR